MRPARLVCLGLAFGLCVSVGCDQLLRKGLFDRPVTPENAPPGAIVYTCRPGDNPWALAQRAYGEGWMAVWINRANDRQEDDMAPFEAGEKIYLPPSPKGQPVNPARMATPYGPDIG